MDAEEGPSKIPAHARFDRSRPVSVLVDDLVVWKASPEHTLLPQKDERRQRHLVPDRQASTLNDLGQFERTDLGSAIAPNRPLGLGGPQRLKHLDRGGVKIDEGSAADRQGGRVHDALGEHGLELVRCHRDRALTGPHKVAATVRKRLPDRPRADADDDHAALWQAEFGEVDPLTQLAVQFVHLLRVVPKRIGPDDGARDRIRNPEDEVAAALVRESDEVLVDLPVREGSTCLLELEPFALRTREPRRERVLGDHVAMVAGGRTPRRSAVGRRPPVSPMPSGHPPPLTLTPRQAAH